MRMRTILLALCGFAVFLLQAQENYAYKFRVYLKDKGSHGYTVNEPERFLSPQSIERKKQQNVTIDATDFPLSTEYFNQISQAGGTVVSHSKWFKTMVVELQDSSQIGNISELSFVDSIQYVWRGLKKKKEFQTRPRLASQFCIDLNDKTKTPEMTAPQFVIHNASGLYEAGYSGRGINIAVIDAGFTNVDVIPYFGPNNIIAYKSFVPDGNILSDSDHGTKVFSTMSAVVPGKMMGSSPAANFYLLHSEDVSTEFPVEEDYWIRAVEYADSIGIDLINSSLGYSNFDDEQLNYSHSQLDGKSSLMSLAADMAFDKGMIVVTSAGNEGSKAWEKISVPGDAAKALTVGAIGTDSIIASFSSKGFTADNRLKPDVVSVGRGAITIDKEGKIESSNGTSFSSPFMAGLIAALWSVNPEMNRSDLLDIVKESGDRFHNPDSVYGNGIPDMGAAMTRVLASLNQYEKKYEDDLFAVMSSDNHLDISLKDEKFNPKTYGINLLNQNGRSIGRYIFEENKLSINIDAKLKESNDAVFILFTAPHAQKTIHLKL